MSEQRIESLRRLVDAAPSDHRARLFLAHEFERAGRWAEAAVSLERRRDIARNMISGLAIAGL